MAVAHILGFPRIGAKRELKFALDAYWKGDIPETDLLATGRELRRRHWALQRAAGLDYVTVGDFAWYDHVLQTGRNPKRMAELGLTEYGLERFALAGNVNDWIERIGELAELGASRLWLSTEAGDLDRQIHYMKVFTEQIMPHFR